MQGASPLLTPTLAEHVPRDWSAALPWRLGSQVYVAVLGGPIAVAIIAVLNARRLRMPGWLVGVIVAIGVTVFAATMAVSTAITDDDFARLVRQLSGAAAFGLMYLVQRPYDRVHHLYSPNEDEDDNYASLWGPGLAVLFAALLVDGLVAGEVTT